METLREQYAQLESFRQPFLEIAKRVSELTLPKLFPTSSDAEAEIIPNELNYPFHGMPARGVSNLSSKLLMTLFPPNEVFFRLQVLESELRKSFPNPEQYAQAKLQFDTIFSTIEKIIQRGIETSAVRSKGNEFFKQLIISGNSLMEFKGDEDDHRISLKVYKLNSYVVKRDGDGKIVMLIIKKMLNYSALPEQLKTSILKQRIIAQKEHPTDNEKIAVYCGLVKNCDGVVYCNSAEADEQQVVDISGKGYTYFEEVDGIPVTDSVVRYKKWEEVPFIVGRWSEDSSQDYGRGLCEEYFGDLNTINELQRCIIDAGFAASRFHWGVNQDGLMNPQDLENAENGSYIPCKNPREDIVPLTNAKGADMQIQQVTVQGIEQRLSYAFLLNSAVQRQAERVTAEEIRFMAQELESAHAGMYAQLSKDVQLPLVQLIVKFLGKVGDLPELPSNTVDILITTGVDALGRGNEFSKLTQWLSTVVQFGGEAALSQLDFNSIAKRFGNSLSLDTAGLLKSPEQVAQEQQQAQMMAMAQSAAPQVAKGMVDNMSAQAQPIPQQ